MGSKPKVPHPVRQNRAAVHLADSISGSEGHGVQRSNESYCEAAFVIEGEIIELSESYGYGDCEGSGTSTLQTPTYATESYEETTDPVLAFQRCGHTLAPRLQMEDKVTSFRRPGISSFNGRPGPQYPVKKHRLI